MPTDHLHVFCGEYLFRSSVHFLIRLWLLLLLLNCMSCPCTLEIRPYGAHYRTNTHKVSVFFFLFVFSRAAPAAYGGSHTRGPIGAVAASLQQSHSNTGSKLHLWSIYTTAHGNAGSLTHWARPGIKKLTTSWFLVGFANHWAMTGTPQFFF